jgi:hypothetical protein
MRQLHGLLFLLLLTLLQACSWEGTKRTTYETVESLRIQQCLNQPDDAECSTQRQRYDQYESERQQFRDGAE